MLLSMEKWGMLFTDFSCFSYLCLNFPLLAEEKDGIRVSKLKAMTWVSLTQEAELGMFRLIGWLSPCSHLLSLSHL